MRPSASKYLYGKIHFIVLGEETLQCDLQKIKYTSATNNGVIAAWQILIGVFICMIEIFGVAHTNEMSGILSASNSYGGMIHLGKVLLIVMFSIIHVLPLKNSEVKQIFCQMRICQEKSQGEK